ncbi:MAG: type II toxin-antitoxin system HicB family antitoxin [Solirubrobacterales bacterium]|nr:type II toxin-antitoxin system HicB family antitoxin [Solirubrobacterales bacterium]
MTDPERYTILLERADDGGWGAWSPDLPGCVALGDTIEQAISEMREAIAFHLEGLAEGGDLVPEPTGPGVYIEQHAVTAAA